MAREIIDSVEKLEAELDRVRAAQREFATYTQEQVDKIFFAAAMAANKARIPLAKMAVGIIEAFIGGLLVLPVSLLFMGSGLHLVLTVETVLALVPLLLLIALASASLGLLVGTIVKPMEIAAMFPGFLMPLVFTGAIFFSWGALSSVPVFQVLVLLNPLVYANEALRYVTMPQLVSMPLYFSLLGLFISTVLMAGFGFRRFHHMASSQNGR